VIFSPSSSPFLQKKRGKVWEAICGDYPSPYPLLAGEKKKGKKKKGK